MIAELHIGTDPTRWYMQAAEYDTVAAGLAQPGTPFAVDVLAPLKGRLVLSARAAGGVAVVLAFTPVGWVPSGVFRPSAPLLYLPSAAGPTHDDPGYTLAAGTDLAALEQELITAMGGSGNVLSVALDVPGPDAKGTLLLSGATLAYAVLCPATASG